MNTYISELILHPWAGWLVAALIAAVIEVALPYFTFIFVALAAAAASCIAVVAGPIVQVVAFLIVMLISLWLLRPRFVHRKHAGHPHGFHSRSEALIGMDGRVTEAIDPRTGTGRVLVDGQDWAARAQVPLGPETVVSVESHDGIVLIVKEK